MKKDKTSRPETPAAETPNHSAVSIKPKEVEETEKHMDIVSGSRSMEEDIDPLALLGHSLSEFRKDKRKKEAHSASSADNAEQLAESKDSSPPPTPRGETHSESCAEGP